jgi:hypothetical protein
MRQRQGLLTSRLWILQSVSVYFLATYACFPRSDVQGRKFAHSFESFAAALALASDNAKRNGWENTISFVHSDVLDYLEQCAREKKTFDIVVLDPPKVCSHALSAGC